MAEEKQGLKDATQNGPNCNQFEPFLKFKIYCHQIWSFLDPNDDKIWVLDLPDITS